MARKKYTTEDIIRMLREAEVELANGLPMVGVLMKLGVRANAYYRWRKESGGLKVDQAKRLKDLERENGRPKMLLADAHLDNAILKEAASGNFWGYGARPHLQPDSGVRARRWHNASHDRRTRAAGNHAHPNRWLRWSSGLSRPLVEGGVGLRTLPVAAPVQRLRGGP